jgi:hypothetical protein
MKTFLSTIIIVLGCSFSAAAQASQAPPIKPILRSVGNSSPMAMSFTLSESNKIIIRSHNKSYRLDSAKVIHSIKNEWISNLTIKHDTTYTDPKRLNFNNTTIVTLDDAAHPEAFTTLKQSLIGI